jgi:hypothetical protein
MAAGKSERIKRNHRIKVETGRYVTASDGVRLSIKIYRPDAPGKFPTLFAPSPYQHDTDTIPHSTMFLWREVGPVDWYVAEHGYAYVRLDVRGSGRSGGTYGFFSRDEQRDLYEVIEWIGRQEWSNGRVGGLGQSYYAMSQWFMGIVNPPSLKCIAPYDGMTDFYRDATYHGGIYCDFFAWWCNLIRVSNLHRAASGPNGTFLAHDLAAEFITRQTFDDWWRERTPHERIGEIKVPVLSIGHWGKMGLHLRGNVCGYEDLKAPKKLVVTGARDVFEAHDYFDHVSFHRDWLLPFYDRYLKDAENGYEKLPNVRVFVRGPDAYRGAKDWPLAETKPLVLHLGKKQSRSVGSLNDGSLAADPPARSGGSTAWTYPDPEWKLGNVKVGPRGPDPVARVLTFTTAPLAEDTEVVGPIVLELHAASTNIDTDFIVKLSDQSPQAPEERKQGIQPASVVVTKGWLRASHRAKDDKRSKPHRPYYTHRDPQPIEPGRIYKYEIEVMPCGHVFKAGHRIRLEISNADSPLTDSLFTHQYNWYKVGTDTIHHSAAYPSRLTLPVAAKRG